MTWLFIGGDIEAFRLDTTLSNINFQSSYCDTTYSKSGFAVTPGYHAWGDFPSNQTEVWWHADLYSIYVNLSQTIGAMLDSATGTNRIQLEVDYSSTAKLRLGYYNGSGFTYLTESAFNSYTIYTIDVHVKLDGSAGVVEFYVNGNLVGSFSGDTSGIATSFSGIEIYSSGYGSTYWSQCMVGDGAQSTVGLKLLTLEPQASGTANNWTNGSSVSYATDYNDSTYITSNTDGQVSQYTVNSAPSGSFNVLAVSVSATARKGASGNQNIQLGVHSNGSDSWSPNVSGLTTNFGPIKYTWGTNPNNSGAAWTLSDLSGFQVGVKSVA